MSKKKIEPVLAPAQRISKEALGDELIRQGAEMGFDHFF